MIVVKLMGGLGNQMFQYAVGLALAQRHKAPLLLDTSGYENMSPEDTPRPYVLNFYKIDEKIAGPKILAGVQPQNSAATIKDKVIRRVKNGGKLWQIHEPSPSYYPYLEQAPKNSYLVGWWQNERYFASIRKTLLDEFRPRTPLTRYSQQILEQIETAPVSVAVHVRRGDYIANKNANKFHGLAPIEYYNSADKYFSKKFKPVLYVVFSDDIAWCKKNLKFSGQTIFVEPQKGRQDCEDIMIMSACNHNVIANSSFSWWGAWLNDNPKKIVIAPRVWFQDQQADKQTEIVPKSWIRL